MKYSLYTTLQFCLRSLRIMVSRLPDMPPSSQHAEPSPPTWSFTAQPSRPLVGCNSTALPIPEKASQLLLLLLPPGLPNRVRFQQQVYMARPLDTHMSTLALDSSPHATHGVDAGLDCTRDFSGQRRGDTRVIARLCFQHRSRSPATQLPLGNQRPIAYSASQADKTLEDLRKQKGDDGSIPSFGIGMRLLNPRRRRAATHMGTGR